MASGFSNNGAHYISLEARRAILFCNEPNEKDDLGMRKDFFKLKNILEELKFEVQLEMWHTTLTAVEQIAKLKTFRDKNTKASCLFVFILTHGNETTFEVKTGDTYKINELLTTVSTDENKNIPKIVFINACLGKKRDYGFEISMDTTDGRSDQTLAESQLPPNLLVACATTPVYVAVTYSRGSAFIKQICKSLQKRDDFMSSLTVANYEVSKLIFNLETDAKDIKQMPFIMSNLTSKLYLKPLSAPNNFPTPTGPGNPLDKVTSPTPAKANIKEREHEDNYNMKYGQKGLALILYDSKTDKNRVNYKELFEKLGSFTVKEYTIGDKLTKTLQTVASEYRNHQEYSCFVCCIAAKYSGEQPCILFPPYWNDDMQEYFENDACNFFVGKPKIFVMHLEENEAQVYARSISDARVETDGKVRIPKAADILIYSVKENFSSKPGSTTAAAKIISAKLKSAQVTKKDVVTALTEASQAITEKKQSTPTTFSTLTGKVFL